MIEALKQFLLHHKQLNTVREKVAATRRIHRSHFGTLDKIMPNLFLILPLQNESAAPVKVLLEPVSEYFFIQPGEKVEIHGICDENTKNATFTIAPNDSFLTVYAPGEITGYIDCYITRDGQRLNPDGY
ncbi:MAG TPA: hypothetical protein VF800_27565 [Telluria sp.]